MNAQERFENFLSKYQPSVAAEAKKSLAKLRKLIPNATEMVYDSEALRYGPFLHEIRATELLQCNMRVILASFGGHE